MQITLKDGFCVTVLLPFVMVAKLVLVSVSVNLLSLGFPGALTLPGSVLVINLWLVSSHSPKYTQCPVLKMPKYLMEPTILMHCGIKRSVHCRDPGHLHRVLTPKCIKPPDSGCLTWNSSLPKHGPALLLFKEKNCFCKYGCFSCTYACAPCVSEKARRGCWISWH